MSYHWGALGRRIASDSAIAGTMVYAQSGQQSIAHYAAGMMADAPTYNYVYAGYIDEPVLRDTPSTSEKRHYHRNQQNSITALTDSTGFIVERYSYSAYGQPTIADASGTVQTGSSTGNRYMYTAREWDGELALHHFRARAFDSNLGRFLSRDPAGYLGSKWSLKEYVEGSPLNYVDPTGMFLWQNYGSYCGWEPRGPGLPIDSLDAACEAHDKCLATFSMVLTNPCRIAICNANLCNEGHIAFMGGCNRDWPAGPSRDNCKRFAIKLLAACSVASPGSGTYTPLPFFPTFPTPWVK